MGSENCEGAPPMYLLNYRKKRYKVCARLYNDETAVFWPDRQQQLFSGLQATTADSLVQSSLAQSNVREREECTYTHTLREALDVKYLKPRQPLSGLVTTCTLVICLQYECSQGENCSFVTSQLETSIRIAFVRFGIGFLTTT